MKSLSVLQQKHVRNNNNKYEGEPEDSLQFTIRPKPSQFSRLSSTRRKGEYSKRCTRSLYILQWFFMNLLIKVKRNMMDHWTLHKLLTIKNNMNLSLFIAYTVKCQFFTIPDISMHFGYATRCTQSVYIFYILFMNKLHNVCWITEHLNSCMRCEVFKM